MHKFKSVYVSNYKINQIKSNMKKNSLYYAVWAMLSAVVMFTAIYAVYNFLIPIGMFGTLIIISLGSLGISCHEWEQMLKRKEVDNAN